MPIAASLTWSTAPRPYPPLGLFKAIREARFATGLECPRCRSRRIIRWGAFSGRRRYRCKGCRRTFSDLTATPLAYSKKPGLWPAFSACMVESATVREVARRLGVDKDTAWRWRHALLAAHLRTGTGRLQGTVELVQQKHLRCEKGSRDLVRAPHRRGRARSGTWSAGVWVILGADRSGGTAARVTGPRATMAAALDFVARQCARARVVLGGDPPLSPLPRAVRSRGGRYEKVPGWSHPRTRQAQLHTLNASRFARSFRQWLRRFRGVASKYLPRYVHWFWLLEPLLHRHLRLLLEAERAPP